MAMYSVVAVAVVAVLSWFLIQRFRGDRIATITARRRPLSRVVSRGEFVDGNRHMDVALALTQSTLFYENGDMEASLDLDAVREVEYDTELATGTVPPHGRVLRLRSNSQTFEFVVPNDDVSGWHSALPPRRSGDGTTLVRA